MKVILASASERRSKLLKTLISDFDILPSNFQEKTVLFNGDCSKYVMEVSKGKALCVSKKVNRDDIIIGCDTIVSFDEKVLGKPHNKKEAFNMLKSLSGKVHKVYTGITIISKKSNLIESDFACTEVKFSNITDEMIQDYIETDEPMDKAGGYGIQGYAGIFVEKINGCYYNVVGLPLNKLYFMLREIGVNI